MVSMLCHRYLASVIKADDVLRTGFTEVPLVLDLDGEESVEDDEEACRTILLVTAGLVCNPRNAK